MFVTFEGIEGSGKSTQLALLAARLTAAGREVVRTREPGGTPLGDEVRGIFLRPREAAMSAETELFLILAARAEHVRTVVRPALGRGAVVLCDRYADATFAYQGAGRGLPRDTVVAANRLATGGLVPDWTVLLDLPVPDGLARVRARAEGNAALAAEGRLDAEAQNFHERVRAGYLELAAAEPARFSRIDASGSSDAIAAAIAAEATRRGLPVAA